MAQRLRGGARAPIATSLGIGQFFNPGAVIDASGFFANQVRARQQVGPSPLGKVLSPRLPPISRHVTWCFWTS
jgi:hypothetical protein